MSKLRILIGFTLIFVLILLPTAAFAKSFGSPNTELDEKYDGTNLTINKLRVSVNQTVRVKLTLKQEGTKAPDVEARLSIVSSTGTTIPDLTGVTGPSGKVIWKFKIRDCDHAAMRNDTLTLTVFITDKSGNEVLIGSTVVTVR